jgi:hypothetical protein
MCASLNFVQGAVSPWVLGWQFAAGERIPQNGSLFGDLDSQQVFLTTAGQQRAAVFSKSLLHDMWHNMPSRPAGAAV